jgi:hypothetical protein
VAIVLLIGAGCAAPGPTASPPPTCALGNDNARPAPATMLDAAGDDVAGQLGTFNYCGASAAADWPAAADLPSVTLTSDEINVVVSVDEDPPFLDWQARYAPAAGGANPIDLDAGSTGGAASISFAGPPAGDWVMAVTLSYPDDIGQATWYWLVAAP